MSYQNDVKVFMKIGSQLIQKELTLDTEEAKLYMKLISEEYKETLDAFKNKDLIELADGLTDMVWVIMGMCNSCGIQFDNVWKEVRASNMSKFVDGKAVKNDYGKIMKPESYFKPNIKKALGLVKT
tara:strand:+ start:2676 stop:3053 length:378 start_codon:yes stop_codon:yes gene_type:complete